MSALCGQCGLRPLGDYEISLRGEVTCGRHPVIERCLLCAVPRTLGAPGWRPFTDAANRCPSCVTEAVETQEDARRHLPVVRRQMAELGIRLVVPVRVTLVAAALLDSSGMTFGLTHGEQWLNGKTKTIGVQIARGLTTTHFGLAAAHELGHCWLSDRGAVGLDQTLQEGLCELFACAWLKKQRTPFAAAVRRNRENNPDPVYGDGYRMVHAAVERSGITKVLDHLIRERCLP